MLLWWILGLALVLAFVWFIVPASRRGGPPAETPEQILKRRYARGEMDRQEYERKLEDLRR